MKCKLLPTIIAVFTVSALSFCPRLKAQEISHEEKHSFSIGIEGGWMRSQQSGSLMAYCECGGVINDGKGSSGISSLFVELELSRHLSIGARIGLDFKSNTSSHYFRDTSLVAFDFNDSTGYAILDETVRVNTSAAYLFFAPYISFTPFNSGFFIRFAPEFGSLLSSNFTQSREIGGNIILLNGVPVSHVRFLNGTGIEALEDMTIPDVNKLRIALFFSAGYDFHILNNFSVLPEVSYNLPLTAISSGNRSTNWKISSFALELGIKYRFD